MTSLAILGAGGHGKVVAECAVLAGWDEIVFYDDAYLADTYLHSFKVAGTLSTFFCNPDAHDGVHVAIGDNEIRKNICNEIRDLNLVSIIHPGACISNSVQIMAGVAVMAGVVVNASSIIRDGAILNTGAIIDHDCDVGEFSHISPGVAMGGGVNIGPLAWVGIGSSVIQNVTIGVKAIIGAGSSVISDIPGNKVALGSPCKVLRDC